MAQETCMAAGASIGNPSLLSIDCSGPMDHAYLTWLWSYIQCMVFSKHWCPPKAENRHCPWSVISCAAMCCCTTDKLQYTYRHLTGLLPCKVRPPPLPGIWGPDPVGQWSQTLLADMNPMTRQSTLGHWLTGSGPWSSCLGWLKSLGSCRLPALSHHKWTDVGHKMVAWIMTSHCHGKI